MEKVKVALIGFGHLGKWHADKASLLQKSELVAIVESYPPNQEAARLKFKDVKIVSDIKEIIDEIDAALVVTPSSTHFEICKYLLQNKKHVFCEKPLCSNMKEAGELESLLLSSKIFQVGHSERFHEAWEKLSSYFSEVKSPFLLKINRFAPFKGRATDVDVVQDLMIHDLDLCLFTLKKMPVKVRSIGHKIRTDKWDSVTSCFTYEDGSLAMITSGRNHTKEVRELEITYSQGVLNVDLFRNSYSQATSLTFEDGSFVKEESYNKRDHLLLEQENFYESILENKVPLVDFYSGKKAVYLVDKVLESLESGCEVELHF